MQTYSMRIQWDSSANTYTVSFPDFPNHRTDGTSWTDAARNGELLLGRILESGEQPVVRTVAKRETKDPDEEAKRQREREKQENYSAWLHREADRMRDEHMGAGYSQFVADWIDEHNGNGDSMDDAWKQTEAYKAKQEERQQKSK
jgi:hypothetical protein